MTEPMPKTIYSAVPYRLTIRALESGWSACYEWDAREWGRAILHNTIGHGKTIDEALNDLRQLILGNKEKWWLLHHLFQADIIVEIKAETSQFIADHHKLLEKLSD